MSTPNTGGPAFPDGMPDYFGVTIRQYYKATAILAAGMIAHDNGGPKLTADQLVKEIGSLTGRIADAMLAEDAAHAAKQREDAK